MDLPTDPTWTLEDIREATIRYRALIASGYNRELIVTRTGYTDLPSTPRARSTETLVNPAAARSLRRLWRVTREYAATDATVGQTRSQRHHALAVARLNGWTPMAGWDEDEDGRLTCTDSDVGRSQRTAPKRGDAPELRLRLLTRILHDPWTSIEELLIAERMPTGSARVQTGIPYSRLRHPVGHVGHTLMPPWLLTQPWPHPQARADLLAIIRAVDMRRMSVDDGDAAATAIICALPEHAPEASVRDVPRRTHRRTLTAA